MIKKVSHIIKYRLLLSSIICLAVFSIKAQQYPNSNQPINDLKEHQYHIYIEKNDRFNLGELINDNATKYFTHTIDEIEPFSQLVFWVKVDNINPLVSNQILQIYCPNATSIMLYAVKDLKYQQINSQKRRNDFYIAEMSGSYNMVLIKVKTNQFSKFEFKTYSLQSFFKKEMWLNLYYGIIAGIFLLLILYHLMLYFKVNDRLYLYYIIFILFSGLIVLPHSGLLSFDNLFFQSISFSFFQISCILLSVSYLNLKNTYNKLYKISIGLIGLIMVLGILFVVLPSLFIKAVINLTSLLLYVSIIFVSFLLSRKAFKPASLFISPWIVLFIAHAILFINSNSIFQYQQVFELGILFNICLLALAIGSKLNLYKNEKNKAESNEIKALIERDRIIHEQNSILELLIHGRNKEILEKNKILSEQQIEIEQHNEIINKSNQQLEFINHELYNKNNEIATQNEELKRHHELLEIIVTKRTKKLTEAKERAIVADRLKTSFLNNLTHEIRTPMNAITGFASMLNDKNNTKEKRNEYLSIINKNVDILLESIDNVVTLARIQARAIKPKTVDFNVHELFRSCLKHFNEKLKNSVSEHCLTLHLKNLTSEKEIILHADYDKIWQILYKLIDNSIKFTEKGEINVTYKLNQSTNDQNNYSLNVLVEDTGIGIESEKLEFIFERFSNIENDKTKLYHGAGIGLAIVKGFVDILNGKINVKSKVDMGTSFKLDIPVLLIR